MIVLFVGEDTNILCDFSFFARPKALSNLFKISFVENLFPFFVESNY